MDEITDLASVWDGQRCGLVQRRFHALVTAKIRMAEAHVGELRTFTGQLPQSARQLSAEPVDGPCDADCACVKPAASATVMARFPVMLGSKPVDVPIACTLEAGAMPTRLADWDAILATARRRVALGETGLRVEFGADVDVAELARLVVAEQRCCAFFSFALTVDGRGIGLEIVAPEGAARILADLFGSAS